MKTPDDNPADKKFEVLWNALSPSNKAVVCSIMEQMNQARQPAEKHPPISKEERDKKRKIIAEYFGLDPSDLAI